MEAVYRLTNGNDSQQVTDRVTGPRSLCGGYGALNTTMIHSTRREDLVPLTLFDLPQVLRVGHRERGQQTWQNLQTQTRATPSRSGLAIIITHTLVYTPTTSIRRKSHPRQTRDLLSWVWCTYNAR